MNETELEPVVAIKGISKAFEGHDVLKTIDLNIKKGENLVILGKSGSGKSTLIKCLIGLMQPDAGEIFVFGKEISSISYEELNELRKKIGFLFQNGALYDSMTVRQNLAFPLKHHKQEFSGGKLDEVIMEMLGNVGLQEAVEKMPSELSGGMSKRIGLARALILKPDIILYDEPTTGLDTATAKEINQLILDIQKKYKTTSIIITHDMACAKMTADRIVMLREGAIVAEGSYEELERSDDEWIKSFFI